MKKNKFIPIAVLACLGVVALAMNNKQCITEAKECFTASTTYTKQPNSKEEKGKKCKKSSRRCGTKQKKKSQ